MIILFIRGLLSVFLSHAMEELTDRVNAKFGVGTAIVTDHGWAFSWFSNVPTMINQCVAAHKRHEKIILIGHSFGATSVLMIARALAAVGIEVDFAGPIDPAAQYDTSITSNVVKGLSYYQLTPGQLGQGIVHADGSWPNGEFAKRFTVTRRDETHLQIAADPVVQDAMFNAVVQELKK